MRKTPKARIRRPSTASAQVQSEGLEPAEAAPDQGVAGEPQPLPDDQGTAVIDPGDTKKMAVLEEAFRKVLNWVVSHDAGQVEAYIQSLRAKYPDLDNEALARKMLSKASLQAGAAGFVTGMSGVLTLPVTVPANLLATWRIQAVMVIRMAYLFGANRDKEELERDVLLVMAGDAAKDALKAAGVAVGQHWTKKAVDRLITRQVMKQIWKVVPRAVITKAGQKSLMSFARMVPGVGGAVSFGFDWTYAQLIGRRAIAYYRDGY